MEIPSVIRNSVPKACLKKKGDLATATDDGQLDTVSVGADGTVLTADSSQPTGFKWVSGNGGSANWGGIVGNLSNQTDLVNALNDKEPANTNIQAHIAAIGNPHGTTSTEIGLGNVTNEAQLAKNIGTAKGSLIGFSGAGTPLEVAVGADNKVLTADSTQPSGVAWKDAPGGSTAWGGIGGTLSNQIDLQIALQSKSDVNHTHTSSQVGLANVTNDKQVKAATISADGNFVSWSGSTGDSVIDSGKKAADFAAVAHTHAPSQVGLGNVTDDAQVKKVPVSVDSNLVVWSGTTGDTVADSGKKISDLALANHNHDGVYEPANANIQSHIISTANPHNVTAGQVLPAQAGNNGKFLTTNGTMVSWGDPAAGTPPAGNGFRHVTGGIEDAAAKLVADADVAPAAAIAESKLSLNYPTHSNTNDPATGEKAALAGTSGTPGAGNLYVTDADPRNTNARTPTAHGSSAHTGTIGTPSQVGLGNVTDDAQLKAAAGDFASFTEKTSPVGTDLLLIEDSAASGAKKKVQVGNLAVGSAAWTAIASKPEVTVGDTGCGATIQSALTAIGTNEKVLIVPPGNYAGPATVPSNITIRFTRGAVLTSGALTVNGAVEAGEYSILNGGTIVFGSTCRNPYVNPRWWGAKGDDDGSGGGTDDYNAFAAMLTAINTQKMTVKLSRGKYKFGSNIMFPVNVVLDFADGAMLSPHVIAVTGNAMSTVADTNGSGTITSHGIAVLGGDFTSARSSRFVRAGGETHKIRDVIYSNYTDLIDSFVSDVTNAAYTLSNAGLTFASNTGPDGYTTYNLGDILYFDVVDELQTIPSNASLQVLDYAIWHKDISVKKASDNTSFQYTSGSPVTGYYTVNANGRYQFSTADAGVQVKISYTCWSFVSYRNTFSQVTPVIYIGTQLSSAAFSVGVRIDLFSPLRVGNSQQIFTGRGMIRMGMGAVPYLRPEWWGFNCQFIDNAGIMANTQALEKCVNTNNIYSDGTGLVPMYNQWEIRFGTGAYTIDRTIYISYSIKLRGTGYDFFYGSGSRLKAKSNFNIVLIEHGTFNVYCAPDIDRLAFFGGMNTLVSTDPPYALVRAAGGTSKSGSVQRCMFKNSTGYGYLQYGGSRYMISRNRSEGCAGAYYINNFDGWVRDNEATAGALSEMIAAPDFSSGWTQEGSDWTIAQNNTVHTPGATGSLKVNLGMCYKWAACQYKVEIQMVDNATPFSGSITPKLVPTIAGNTTQGRAIVYDPVVADYPYPVYRTVITLSTDNASYSQVCNLYLTPSSDFNGAIKNVSVKRVGITLYAINSVGSQVTGNILTGNMIGGTALRLGDNSRGICAGNRCDGHNVLAYLDGSPGQFINNELIGTGPGGQDSEYGIYAGALGNGVIKDNEIHYIPYNGIYIVPGMGGEVTRNKFRFCPKPIGGTTTPSDTSAGDFIYVHDNVGLDTPPQDYPGAAASVPAWQASTSFTRYHIIQPTTPNGYYYQTSKTATTGATEPTWPTTIGGAVKDGNQYWTNIGTIIPMLNSSNTPNAGLASNWQSKDTTLTITDFLGCPVGKDITVKFTNGGNVLKFSGTTNLRGNNGVDWTVQANDLLRARKAFDGKWDCQCLR